jgi:hypothetical protein
MIPEVERGLFRACLCHDKVSNEDNNPDRVCVCVCVRSGSCKHLSVLDVAGCSLMKC